MGITKDLIKEMYSGSLNGPCRLRQDEILQYKSLCRRAYSNIWENCQRKNVQLAYFKGQILQEVSVLRSNPGLLDFFSNFLLLW